MATIEVSEKTKRRIEAYLAGRHQQANVDSLLERAFDVMDADDTYLDDCDTRLRLALAGCAEG